MPKPDSFDNRQKLPEFYSTHPAQRAQITLVATPIGNLGDFTDRARQAFIRADEIWCEDTRLTQQLFSALKIESQAILKRLDEQASELELQRKLEEVSEKKRQIVVVSDAGTPGISDPGGKVVAQAIHFPDVRVQTIPGASSLLAHLAGCPMGGPRFRFIGFFPREEKDQHEVLLDFISQDQDLSLVFFESPHRIRSTLSSLQKWSELNCSNLYFSLSKELTKLHESKWMGEGPHFFEKLFEQGFDDRGEWVVSLHLPKGYVINQKTSQDWELALNCLILAEVPVKKAAQIISAQFSVAKNLAYDAAIKIKK